MKLVLLTAFGVGGATVIGALIGFAFKKISHKFSDIILGFAAGVMLAAAVLGLIIPSLEYGGTYGILITVAGIFAGAVCLNLIDGGIAVRVSFAVGSRKFVKMRNKAVDDIQAQGSAKDTDNRDENGKLSSALN